MGAKTHYEDASSFLLLFVCFKGGMGAKSWVPFELLQWFRNLEDFLIVIDS